MSLTIKLKKKIILVGLDNETNSCYKKLEGEQVVIAKDYVEAIKMIKALFT